MFAHPSRSRQFGLLALSLALVLAMLLSRAQPAAAADTSPCGALTAVSWSSESVQLCPLSSPVASNGWIPVYRTPVPNPRGATPPAPAGWMHGIQGQYFVCERSFTSAVFYHPGGWRNYWWAYTLSDDNLWGWVPEVFFRGGLDDEPDGGSVNAGLRGCPAAVKSPAPTPTPIPTPPTPGPTPPPPAEVPCETIGEDSDLRLVASVDGEGRVTTTRSGRPTRVIGALLDPFGNPVSGANLCVGQIDPNTGTMRQSGSITTDGQGHFVYTLEPESSRRVWFVHQGSDGTESTSILVKVRAALSLTASPPQLSNGQTVFLRGRIAGGPDARGVLVELQAPRGNRWQTFGTTTTKKRGFFLFKYRFTRTFDVQKYELRARIPRQRGYPYAPGASQPVEVTVRG